MIKLFRLFSRISGVNYEDKKYDNVLFNWFVIDRKDLQIPGENAIINYNTLLEDNREKAELYIKELFTKEEADALKNLLDSLTNGFTGIEEINLPIPDNLKNYNSLSPGNGIGFTDFYKRKNYNLPFKVRALFNINDAEESISADDRPTVITPVNSNIFKNNK